MAFSTCPAFCKRLLQNARHATCFAETRKLLMLQCFFRMPGDRGAARQDGRFWALTLCPGRCGTGKEPGPQNCAPLAPGCLASRPSKLGAILPSDRGRYAIEAATLRSRNASHAAMPAMLQCPHSKHGPLSR